MTTTWALVADRAEADVVELGPHSLTFIRHADHDATGRDGMEPKSMPRESLAREFARELAHAIDDDRVAHRFDRLILAAEPHFLGLLRDELTPATKRVVVAEVNKHLLGIGDGNIAAHLRGAIVHP